MVTQSLAFLIKHLRGCNTKSSFACFVSPNTLYHVKLNNVTNSFYKCGKEFHLRLLEQDIDKGDTVGLISMDNTECGFGILKGNNMSVLKSITSGVEGKTRKGGQSSRRYERKRDMYLNDYYTRIAEYARHYFLDSREVMAIHVGGPAFTKHVFLDNNYLEYRLQNKIGRKLDCCYTGEDGLYEMKNMLTEQLNMDQ